MTNEQRRDAIIKRLNERLKLGGSTARASEDLSDLILGALGENKFKERTYYLSDEDVARGLYFASASARPDANVDDVLVASLNDIANNSQNYDTTPAPTPPATNNDGGGAQLVNLPDGYNTEGPPVFTTGGTQISGLPYTGVKPPEVDPMEMTASEKIEGLSLWPDGTYRYAGETEASDPLTLREIAEHKDSLAKLDTQYYPDGAAYWIDSKGNRRDYEKQVRVPNPNFNPTLPVGTEYINVTERDTSRDDPAQGSSYVGPAAPLSANVAAQIAATASNIGLQADVDTAAAVQEAIDVAARDERTIAANAAAATALSGRDVTAATVLSERGREELWAQQQFTYDQNAATRAQTQQQINAEIYNNNAARADNRVQQEFLRDKFSVEVAMGRDAQVLQTEIALDSSVRSGRELSFQYQQLQQTAQQFNATGQMQADVENQRRMEVQDARRAQLATDIGVTAQDAGSRGQLAARLLANPNLGSLDAGLAGGEDFFTGESLVPLTDLLGQRADAAKDPNFLTFNPVTATPLPNIATPQFTTPGQYAVPELGAAYPGYQPTGGAGVVPPPQRPGGQLKESAEVGALRVAAMGGEHSRLMGLGFGTGSDEYKSAMAAVTPSADYTNRHGGMNAGAQLTQLPQSVLDDPRYPGNPGFEMKADGGLASGAYIGDEKGAELHIPLGLGEALVIPHDQVKNFLRKAAADGASLPGMEHGGMVKSQKQVNFLLSKGSPLTSKQRAKLKRELKSGSVKIGAMKKGGKFPEDSVAADLAGMGFGAMELGGVFDQGTIFGTARPTDQTGTRNFLNEALKRALTGTPWQAQGRAPTPVEVSAPGTDRIVQQLGASLSALGTGTPQDLFLRRAAALAPAGITERAGGVRRTA